jgi:aminotransferase
MMTVCNPGDKVVVFSLFMKLRRRRHPIGADAHFCPMSRPIFPRPPPRRRTLPPAPQAHIHCNPSNPRQVFTRDDCCSSASSPCATNAFVITDRSPTHRLRSYVHVSFASLPGIFERTITATSSPRPIHYGLAVSYLVGPAPYIEERQKRSTIFSPSARPPAAGGGGAGLHFGPEYYEASSAFTPKSARFAPRARRTGPPPQRPQGATSCSRLSKYLAKAVFGLHRPRIQRVEDHGHIGVAACRLELLPRTVNHYIRLHFARERTSTPNRCAACRSSPSCKRHESYGIIARLKGRF